MDKMDTELLVQFQALLGIVNEGEIVAECQEQEIGQGGQGKNMPEQNTSFLKQEMVMEQMQIMSM